MKKALCFSLLALLMLACQTELVNEKEGREPLMVDGEEFYATIEAPGATDTKVYADENMKVLWNADDRIVIFKKNTLNQQYRFTGADGVNAGGFKLVPNPDADEFEVSNELDNYYAVYPYDAEMTISNVGVLNVTLPERQLYKENSFGIGANTMVSVSTNTSLRFKNAGGYLAFKFYGDNVKVSSITLEGNNHEKLSGAARIAMEAGGFPAVTMQADATESVTLVCEEPVAIGSSKTHYSEFWFVIPPTTFMQGFTVTVTTDNGGTFSKSVSAGINVVRNSLMRMSALEVVPEKGHTPPDNEIWYTSADGSIITPIGYSYAPVPEDGFGACIVSNTYKDGMGIMRFDGAVTRIPYGAFFDTTIETILLPKTVTVIEGASFVYCGALSSIDIPEGVVEIGGWAFSHCERLSTVGIPQSVTSIGAAPFSVCPNLREFRGKYATTDGRALVMGDALIAFAPSGLTSYSIPDGIITISRNVFDDCSDISQISIPNGVVSIGMAAFAGCVKLVSVVLPPSMEKLGPLAFSRCTSLVSVNIPDSMQDIKTDSFSECVSLKEFTGKFASTDHRLLVINDEIVAFAPYRVTSYSIPSGIKSIGQGVFSYTNNLSSITIPNSVTTIGWNAFRGAGLRSLVIPKSVEVIGNGAFAYCNDIASVDILSTTPPQGGEEMFDCYSYYPIYVPYNSVDEYRTAPYWSEYADRIFGNPFNGHEYVDLGLSVKWAVKNIGANKISDYGSYYAWGELNPKKRYDGSTYLLGTYTNGILKMDYYNVNDNWTQLKLGDDIARFAWGGEWRMPTAAEYNELINKCTWEERIVNNVKGVLFTSTINGNTIFFPYAGLISETTYYYSGTSGAYWTSTKPSLIDNEAQCFVTEKASLYVMKKERVKGLTVRAVVR